MSNMENKNWKVKIKNIIKEKDNRFWLMIFVVLSTIAIFVIWSLNLKNIFPKRDINQEAEELGLDQVKTEFQEDKDDFFQLLNKIGQQKKEEDITQTEIERLKRVVGDKIEENNSLATSADNILATSSMATSSIPIISQDLDDSEQDIEELRKKIEELEKKLGN